MNRTYTYGILSLLLVAMAMTSCEQSDDIETIFTTADWSFTDFCYTPNWNKEKSSMLNIQYDGRDQCHLNQLSFHPDGNVIISMPGCTLSGHWKADGIERSFALTDLKVTSGSLDRLSFFSKKFYDELISSVWYRGDTHFLQLFGPDEHYYLLFGPVR